jgi:hypothetical protein
MLVGAVVSKTTSERHFPMFAPIALLLAKDMGEQNKLSSLLTKASPNFRQILEQHSKSELDGRHSRS